MNSPKRESYHPLRTTAYQPNRRHRRLTIPVDGIPVRVQIHGCPLTVETVDVIKDVIRAMRRSKAWAKR